MIKVVTYVSFLIECVDFVDCGCDRFFMPSLFKWMLMGNRKSLTEAFSLQLKTKCWSVSSFRVVAILCYAEIVLRYFHNKVLKSER